MFSGRKICVLAIWLLLTIVSFAHAADTLNAGVGSFIFKDYQGNQGKPIIIWYYMPKVFKANMQVVFVMHGVKRNGQKYRDSWIKYAEQKKFLLLVPEFSEQHYPGSRQYNLGNMFSPSGKPKAKSKWTYTAIEHIFDYVRNTANLKAESYSIYGHSAGAQFVHRLVLFLPDARINTSISANAGWYTMPTKRFEFPYGLKKSPISLKQLKNAFKQNLIVLLGDKDTDENHKHLRKTREAMAQGKHRFARGINFFKSAKRETARLKVPLNWKVKTVEGVSHSNLRMAEAAAKLISGNKFTTGKLAKNSSEKINVNIVVVGNKDSVDRQAKHKINMVVSKMLSIFSDTFGLLYWQDTQVEIKVFEDFGAFKRYQKKVSKTIKSNEGFYSSKLKEAVVWRNKTPTKMLSIIYHEASHLILRKRVNKCPKWLNEGLAEFFEKSSISGHSIIVNPQGKKDSRIKKWIRDKQIMSLKEYLGLTNDEWKDMSVAPDNISSTVAWSLIYFLMSSDTGTETMKRVIHEMKRKGPGTFSSIKAINRSYPGGLTKLEYDWHSWALKQRKPLLLQ
jgi:archaellin